MTLSLFSFSVSAQASPSPIFKYYSTGFYNYDDVSGYFHNVPASSFLQSFENSTGIHLDDYYYYINVGFYGSDRFQSQIGVFPKVNGLLNNTLNILSSPNLHLDAGSVLNKHYSSECHFLLNQDLTYCFGNSSLTIRDTYALNTDLGWVCGLITNIPTILYNGEPVSKSFVPQITGQFEFINGDLRLNVRALSSADFDNRVYLEIYDALPAVEQLIYKPVKYVYPTYDGHSMHVSGHKIDDYLRPTETGLTYSMTADTLHRAGCVSDNPYNARAYCFDNKGEPFEICFLQFAFAGDDFYTYIDTDGDGAPDVQQIAEKGEDGKYTNNYYDVDTGEKLDPNNLSYNFGYGLEEPASNVYDGTPDYDFDVEISNDIMQGAGLVRTIFDKIIDKSGLSGFLITLLAISIASWFIFGRRA